MLETVLVAFSMYTALPMPAVEWKEKNLRYALCAFPLVGLVIGGCWWLWAWLCARLGLPELPRGAGLCLLPAAITGGIHLDGYADVSDALASHAPPEKKQTILRDPHCGAFAAIRLCMYFVGYFALCAAFVPDRESLLAAGLGFVLSRALSGLALTVLPLAEGSSLARTFAGGANKYLRGALLLEALAAGLGLCLLDGGVLMLASALAVLAWYARTARREFGGVSGDLAGWFLQKAEFWMLAAWVLRQYGGKML